jgi:hypothetical protein
MLPLLDRILEDPTRSDEDRLLARERKEKVNRLLVEISGLWEEAVANQPAVVPGDSLNWEWQVLRRNPSATVKAVPLSLRLLGLWPNGQERTLWDGKTAPTANDLGDSLHRYVFRAALP